MADNDSDGLSLLSLLVDSKSWVHRRVESLRLAADGETRRHVSLDFTLPAMYRCDRKGNRVVVPLAIMEKGVKRRLDATHEGKSVSVLGREENGLLTVDMIIAAIQIALPLGAVQRASCFQLVKQAVFCSEDDDASEKISAFQEWLAVETSNLPADESRDAVLSMASRLVSDFTANFILFIELNSAYVDTRTTVKFALDQEAPVVDGRSFKRVTFGYDVSDFGFAASQHVEIEVPTGLTIAGLEFVAFNAKDVVVSTGYDIPESERRVAHTTLSPAHRFHRGRVFVEVLPTHQGLYSFTRTSLVAILALLVASQLVRAYESHILGELATIPSPSASVLLIGPAILLSWLSRTPEHSLVVELSSPLRRTLFLLALVLLGMATLAAIPVTPAIWWVGWFAIIVLAGSALFQFVRYDYGWEISQVPWHVRQIQRRVMQCFTREKLNVRDSH